ncbi:MAG: ABC transporter substrate-binding protein [Myxococcota bacterium]
MLSLILAASLSWAGTITDAQGNAVSVDDPQRIVTLGGGVSETVAALGLEDKIVGADASSTYPASLQPRATLGYHRNVGAEGILSLSPDLVIATQDAGPPATLAQIQAAGVDLVFLDGSPGLTPLRGRITMLSTLLDANDQGQALLQGLEQSLSAVSGDASPRVMFIYARGAGTLNVSGTGTAAAAMIDLAGAENAVDAYEGYKPLTAEGAVLASPDVLLLTEGGLKSLGGEEGLLRQPGIAQTPAGQARRIVVMDDLLLLGFGPRAGEAARTLSEAIR